MPNDRPPRTGCPSWCVTDHSEITHPDDNIHESEALYVPVILRRRTVHPDGQVTYAPEATEFLIVTTQHVKDPQPWVFIGEPDRQGQWVEVSGESARRVGCGTAFEQRGASSTP